MDETTARAIAADREAQTTDPAVRDRAKEILTNRLKYWGITHVSPAAISQAVGEILRDSAWIRPVVPGCDCSTGGGQGLVPSFGEHADDCPAATVEG